MSVIHPMSTIDSGTTDHLVKRLPRRKRFSLPIGTRLGLGFLAAALLASLITSVLGIQRLQALNQQADLYNALLQKTSDLANSVDDLQLMSTETHLLLYESQTQYPSHETINDTLTSINKLSSRYEKTLQDYLDFNLETQYHILQAIPFSQDTWKAQSIQKTTLAMSALHTWSYYRNAQSQVLQAYKENYAQAIQIERLQAEPLHSDALSGLQQLVRFNGMLADRIGTPEGAAQNYQLEITIISAVVVFLCIITIGLSISHTFIPPLRRLQKVAQAAEVGNLEERVPIHGRDEIAQVSNSINMLLETLLADKHIAHAYEQQRQLNHLKDQFLLNVSHELRTPLTQVYGYLELLSTYNDSLDQDTQITFINNAKDGCQELIHLVTTVLDATNVKSDIKQPTLEKVEVAEEISSVLATFAPNQVQTYSLQIEIPTGCVIEADRAYFRQVVRNLVANVFKYVPEQTPLFIRAEQQGEEIVVSVEDRGPGIPEAELPFLFQKFVRLQRDLSGNVRGTGLGLYISQRLVESMRGRIWAESSGIPGEGSRFSFALPGRIEE